jgi:PAS domain S-box-containing protein
MDSVSDLLLSSESPDALMLLDADGRILNWNRGAEIVFGYSKSEAVNALLRDLLVPPDRRDDQQHQLQETLSGRTTTYESVRRRKDASLLYVDVTMRCTRNSLGELCVISAEKDVTTIKVMRDAKLMDARFRDLLESTPDGIVMANPTGHIVIANSQAERLFGYEQGELRGASVDLLLPKRYRNAHVGHRSNYFQQPRTRAMGSGLDLAGLRKDGSEFPIEISLSPLRTEESAFVMSAIRDISERKRFEKALQEKNQELASANQLKDQFLAGMSHELRTPLNAIIGFTGTLLMKLAGPLNEEQEKQLRTVQSSGRHLLALINDLLDLSRIAAGKVALTYNAVDCNNVLHEVEATLRPQALTKGLAFELLLPPQAVVLNTDRRALCQIVLNLTGNAIKFTESGYVRLTMNCQTVEGMSVVEIQIEDSGVGIPLDDIDKLFGAFTRINPERANAPDGTGLGLHLSQKLAEILGGKISVQSESGCGSRFTLVLPR